MERAIHTNLNPKSPTSKHRNSESFSSLHHLSSDKPNKSEPHHAMKPNEVRTLLHDPTSELRTFAAHKYFNHDNFQRVTINSNSRVSPLLNMDTEHKHSVPEQGDIITKSTRSFSDSASSSVVGGNGNCNNNIIINNYKAHSFHLATPTTPSPSSSKSTLNNKAGLLFHHPRKNPISVLNPPQTSSNLTQKLRTSLSKPIWLLRRKCPCNDKKSVQVKANTQKNSAKPKTSPPQPQTLSPNQIHKGSLNHKASPPTSPSSNKELKSQRLFQFQPAMNQSRRPSKEGFTFPLAMAANSTKPHQVLLNVVHEEEDATPRESLHVFQPPSPSKSHAMMDDDAASDASSDLFEIESFCTQTTTTLPCPIVTPSVAQCHETTDHEFFFAADAGSSLWRRLRDTEVLPPF
ncbi:protein PHYTOCHROME KINASE SUBSTRATE 4-like [Vigna umbellata]|uniref:protein PHYTOCHROME KINASE SUBSTRATE 4-like n=1 Tax=Vigna umbellata TaxID=87088 RepID=UPI001F5E46FC|nr:protein PHYTOCHROME KINASE SUBSTRATE 4-like [Vigna umbellata]